MNPSYLVGTNPEETDFAWPWLSNGKFSYFAVFIFGFPRVSLGLQLILSFWVASWVVGTYSSKQFAWSFPEDLVFTMSLGELDLGPTGASADTVFGGQKIEKIYPSLQPAQGSNWRSCLLLSHQMDGEFSLPWESWQLVCCSWELARGEGTSCVLLCA